MTIKLVVGECTLNVVSAYAPQAGLDEEIKRRFWEGLDDIVRNIPHSERLFIGGDFNGHIGSSANGYTEVHGGFGFREQNGGGTSLLDFSKTFDLVNANSSFLKREEHLVTYQSSVAKTQIDYLLLRRCDRRLCEDCKVIPGKTLATQHRLLVMDIGIMIRRMKRSVRGRPRIRWSTFTKDKAHELEGRLSVMGAWRSSGDANTMWSATADCIRKTAREVLGISSGCTGGHIGDWWWNAVVQGKVEAKKAAYLQLVGSTSEEEKRANSERNHVVCSSGSVGGVCRWRLFKNGRNILGGVSGRLVGMVRLDMAAGTGAGLLLPGWPLLAGLPAMKQYKRILCINLNMMQIPVGP
ncbi:uncharacterized protein [Nicotiana sylvestris]|uniref:uncharacterized protein n=1 Tax=Nicotiana sylvestris TaxID=4096 RepID=UPI00388CB0C7